MLPSGWTASLSGQCRFRTAGASVQTDRPGKSAFLLGDQFYYHSSNSDVADASEVRWPGWIHCV